MDRQWNSPYINRFLSADTVTPTYANPQSLNRYSYVLNNPLRYTDPTGHKEKPEGPPPSWINYSKEDGVCIKHIGCSGGTRYREWWLSHQLPKLKNDLANAADVVGDVIGFGIDTKDHWAGTHTTPKIGFGIDVVSQLIKDAPRKDLSWGQRLTRAGVNGVEGYSISAISASVATESSEAVLGPSISVAVKTEQAWVPPVAVAVTWATTYIATNVALSYVANVTNENLPYFNP